METPCKRMRYSYVWNKIVVCIFCVCLQMEWALEYFRYWSWQRGVPKMHLQFFVTVSSWRMKPVTSRRVSRQTAVRIILYSTNTNITFNIYIDKSSILDKIDESGTNGGHEQELQRFNFIRTLNYNFQFKIIKSNV